MVVLIILIADPSHSSTASSQAMNLITNVVPDHTNFCHQSTVIKVGQIPNKHPFRPVVCPPTLPQEASDNMSSTQSQQTIVVVGATGIQGSGVVRALLDAEYGGPWFVRALTSDPCSGKAQKLLSECQTTNHWLSLVSGSVYDEISLRSAFTGAHGVYAMTSERHPGKIITEEEDLKHEIEAGRNIISAAKECGVKHLVFSSLPDIVKASGGRFKRIHHMNNKYAVEQLARKKLNGFTSLMPGEYSVEGYLLNFEK